ncbi:MAG: class I SAM-dependent methyltransferase [Chloroflexi bacterium]|nr:class I SAM-dependent methyltransferase [Chloroflexota bacterium]
MLREIRELVSYHSKSTIRFAEHDVHNVFEKTLRDLRNVGFVNLEGKRVLDLGCGQRFPFALQCSANGARVTALDINYIQPDFLPLAFYRTIKHNGLKRAAKSVARRMFWDDRYYQALETSAGNSLQLHKSKIKFVVSDPAQSEYPLPAESFGLIVSNAVLEHVQDVPQFAANIARLLDAGGYFYAIIHNFYSLSGGHNLEWAFPDESPSPNVPPWDHLRENRFPAWTYLNRLKPAEYKDAFSKYLRILRFDGVGIQHDPGALEGERWLTPEISAELEAYPRDLLLTRSWRMICQRLN